MCIIASGRGGRAQAMGLSTGDIRRLVDAPGEGHEDRRATVRHMVALRSLTDS
jgi:hypothetical protein